MKSRHKAVLEGEHPAYSRQMGIPTVQRPMLVLERNEYNKVRHAFGERRVDKGIGGECNYEAKTIYVNSTAKLKTRRRYLTKLGRKRTGIAYRFRNVKPTLRDYRNSMVHELVHIRWPSLPHGLKFEQRIKEILNG